MRFPVLALAGLALATLLSGCGSVSSRARRPDAPVWDVRSLAQAPTASWGVRTGLIQEVYYSGPSLNGKPTRVFGYLARPAGTAVGRRPAMVLVHGGGGKAFKEWAIHWAERGYVALAMDLSGNGPDGRLADGGPDQSDAVKFRDFAEADIREMWSYHAVSAVIRGNSLLRSLPDVDPQRIGITGISWGGYLTCIVAGIDHRFKAAVPVYGCGFLGENSAWKDGSLARMDPEARALWLKCFDPGRYLGGVRCPILFLNGTGDFAYPLDSYRKSYRQVPERLRTISVVKDLPHGHIWTFPEVDEFVGAALHTRGRSLPRVGRLDVHGSTVSTPVATETLQTASLLFTRDGGPWQKRNWQVEPAQFGRGRVTGRLPDGFAGVCFIAVTDDRGLRTSSEHAEIPAPDTR